MDFVKDIYRDEFRSGFLVTSHKKKLWNVQLNLVNEFDRICKKYNLRWFAYGGTLLGAARHKGFIPWDDDLDVCMMRPDYEKFIKVAAEEIKPPYFLDIWYNYRHASDGDISLSEESDLPLIDTKHEIFGSWPNFPLIKFRDCRTSMIEFPDIVNINQGIFIDIFCLDPIPPFTNPKFDLHFNIAKELLLAASIPNVIRDGIANSEYLHLGKSTLEKILKLTFKQRALIYEDFMNKHFHDSQKISQLRLQMMDQYLNLIYDTKDFENVVYLPFEETELPAPFGYENLLTALYGDWRKISVDLGHAVEYSADIPYDEYYKNSAVVKYYLNKSD